MPSDHSEFLAASRIIANGLIAANRNAGNAARILRIEAPDATPAASLLNAAVMNGADVAVGPLQRSHVETLAQMPSLPLPVVALNVVPEMAQKSPENLLMLSVSTELEAQYIAGLACDALPDRPGSVEGQKIAVLASDAPWENRIRQAYEHVLEARGVPYDVLMVQNDQLSELRTRLEAKLSPEEEAEFAKMRREARAALKDQALSRRLKNIESERRGRIATSQSAYASALLALDAQAASLVRSSIPLKMRVWATSNTNPGDAGESSTAAALAFDLENIAFAECPLLLRYDASGFEARFGTAMPYSLSAKRLFALGADAFSVAERWASRTSLAELEGETGLLTIDRQKSALVARKPQTVVIKNGELIEVDENLLRRKGELPFISVIKPSEPPFAVENQVEGARRPEVQSIVVEDNGVPDMAPGPRVPPLKKSPSNAPFPVSPGEALEHSPQNPPASPAAL